MLAARPSGGALDYGCEGADIAEPKPPAYKRLYAYPYNCPMEDTYNVRWTISVPKETDQSLRTYLAEAGLKKGALSDFVAEAVRWRLFELNVAAARAVNADRSSEEIEDAIEKALAQVRAGRFRKPA